MKRKHLFVVLPLLVIVTAVVFFGFKEYGNAQEQAIEMTTPAPAVIKGGNEAGQADEENSLFSATIIVTLLAAVTGIVAFRKNSYS